METTTDAAWKSVGSVRSGRGSGGYTDRESSHDQEDTLSPRIAHTLAACCRCRNRKTRCDAGLPRCGPCDRSGVICEYFDTAKGRKIPRTYVIHLQERVRVLEAELLRQSEDDGVTTDDADGIVRHGGLVKLDSAEEPRFLGSSSGIAIARLVMELAIQNTESKSIREVIPEVRMRDTQQKSSRQNGQQVKVYPMISSIAAPSLPSRLVMDKLTEIFNQRAQAMFPTLHEPSFRKDVEAVYNGSPDPYQNFVVRIVLAISMQKLDTQYAGLADSYYLAALPHLEAIVQAMDLKTIQCFVLIGQYSLLTPTRIPVYYMIGLATRLCQQLGFTEEKTIMQSVTKLDAIEKDMRRRIFWIVTNMESGLSHSLGRPSAFAVSTDHIDVGMFEQIDDEHITHEGILPGPPSPKKVITIHFFKMRLLQAEIRRKLYLKTRPEPKDDSDPWFATMENKLEHWRTSSPHNDQGSGLSAIWYTPFMARYNTMVIFLFRPSPQIPHPSVRAGILCYEAATYNLQIQRKMIENHSVDITWIFVQQIFMLTNTLLWTISFPEIRKLHPRTEVEEHLDDSLQSLLLCSDRWPGTDSAFHLYSKLIKVTMKSYNDGSETSSTSYSGSAKASSISPYPEHSSQSPISSPASVNAGLPVKKASGHISSFGYVIDSPPSQQADEPSPRPATPGSNQYDNIAHSRPANIQQLPPETLRFQSPPTFQDVTYSTDATYGLFPQGVPDLLNWNPDYASPPGASTITDNSSMSYDHFQYDGLITGQGQAQPLIYTGQYAAEYHPRVGSLSQEQHMELMNALETDGLEYIGNYLEQSAAFFAAQSVASGRGGQGNQSHQIQLPDTEPERRGSDFLNMGDA